MVEALASCPHPLDRAQLATLAMVQRGGTFSDYLRLVVQADLVEELPDGRFDLTAKGRAGYPPQPPMTTAELVALWRPRLKAGARRMLDLLVTEYPNGYSREDLSDRADVQRGGTFSDYLRSLVKNGLAEEQSWGIVASRTLFP